MREAWTDRRLAGAGHGVSLSVIARLVCARVAAIALQAPDSVKCVDLPYYDKAPGRRRV
jgi:hypothetical protein